MVGSIDSVDGVSGGGGGQSSNFIMQLMAMLGGGGAASGADGASPSAGASGGSSQSQMMQMMMSLIEKLMKFITELMKSGLKDESGGQDDSAGMPSDGGQQGSEMSPDGGGGGGGSSGGGSSGGGGSPSGASGGGGSHGGGGGGSQGAGGGGGSHGGGGGSQGAGGGNSGGGGSSGAGGSHGGGGAGGAADSGGGGGGAAGGAADSGGGGGAAGGAADSGGGGGAAGGAADSGGGGGAAGGGAAGGASIGSSVATKVQEQGLSFNGQKVTGVYTTKWNDTAWAGKAGNAPGAATGSDYAHLDKNGDGKLSSAEAAASKKGNAVFFANDVTLGQGGGPGSDVDNDNVEKDLQSGAHFKPGQTSGKGNTYEGRMYMPDGTLNPSAVKVMAEKLKAGDKVTVALGGSWNDYKTGGALDKALTAAGVSDTQKQGLSFLGHHNFNSQTISTGKPMGSYTQISDQNNTPWGKSGGADQSDEGTLAYLTGVTR
jgi:hypothetical protein